MSETKKAYERGQVVDIIHSVIDKMEGNSPNREVYLQISELAHTIDSLKKDITGMQTGSLKEKHIASATDELDEVIAATAEATNTIMASCEKIEKYAENHDGNELSNYVTEIYQACSFQDVTGQRIRKVFKVLHTIDEKINGLMKTLNEKVGPIAEGHEEEVEIDINDTSTLLNGPQMADEAISQEEIDKLLADFD